MTVTVDAHLHLWDPSLGVYHWLTPAHGILHQHFTAAQARAELDGAGVDRAVLVQAADADADNAAMLAVAEENAWVAAVVAWVDVFDPERAGRQLEALADAPIVRGVRALVHDDPRRGVYALPEVRQVVRAVARQGLTLDVPDAFPRDLRDATRLADDVDDLTLVLDHLGKPPWDEPDWASWARELADFARRPNTVAKVSGLTQSLKPMPVDLLRRTFDHALECFGASRLMLGSDWPITVAGQGYHQTHAQMNVLLEELSLDEQARLRGETCVTVYGIEG